MTRPFFTSDFIQDVAARAERAGLPFDAKEYRRATKTLVDQFQRYGQRAARMLGATMASGIPIGALSSGLIANLALAPLDEHILAVPGVRHYARYVDDILVVAETTGKHERTVAGLAKRDPPVLRTDGQGRIVLDAASMRRPGSALTLTTSKLKGYFLRGGEAWIFSER